MINLHSFQTSENTTPVLEDLSNGYSLLKSYTTQGGAVVCEFTRSVTVPSGSENHMHDLTDSVHVLYAAGAYTNGAIAYHYNDALITDDKIDFFPTPTPTPVRYHHI